MQMLAPEEGLKSFDEVMKGYTEEQAKLEADRCVECGLCVATCPAHMSIPDYIKTVRQGDYKKGLRILYETNPFSSTCGRICTHRCETVCPIGHQGDPLAIRWLKRAIVDRIPRERYRDILGDEVVENGKKSRHRRRRAGWDERGLLPTSSRLWGYRIRVSGAGWRHAALRRTLVPIAG